jgi:hypothetical protein
MHNRIEINYRFHVKEVEGKKSTHIIFNSNTTAHKPYLKNNNIFFYDNKLKTSLYVNKDLFEEILDTQPDFNLSTEQKDLLLQGHDITINVSSLLTNGKLNQQQKTFKKEQKNYVADFSFFLGKCSLLLKENRIPQTTKSLGLTKNY